MNNLYKNCFKRCVDFVLAFVGLIIVSPILILVTICLLFINRGHVFFRQDRPGKNEIIFKVIKFKTMTDAKDSNGVLLPDSERLNGFGKFIRTTSIDELPQLLNILLGNMSLIGPRPLRTYYLPLYNKEQARRHNVLPGITGWAQVNGRNNISWAKKFELDVWYVDNCSFIIDVKIICLTIKKVLFRENINKDDEATTVAFDGKN